MALLACERSVRLISVNICTVHPTPRVVPTLAPSMKGPFWFAVAAFVLLYGLLLTLRIGLEERRAQVEHLYLEADEG
jgi:hypothetical protein